MKVFLKNFFSEFDKVGMGHEILTKHIGFVKKSLKRVFFLQENIHFCNLGYVLDQWRKKKTDINGSTASWQLFKKKITFV